MTPLRLMFLCFLVVLFPFIIGVVLTLATSGEEEYEHAQGGGARTGSPACLACHALMTEIEGHLKQNPLPPMTTAKSGRGGSKENSAVQGDDADAADEAEAFDSAEQETLTKVSTTRRERANEILQSVCRLQHANQKDLCQRILRRQRKEVLTLIFNISSEATPQWVCMPMCVGTVFDMLGDLALRTLGNTIVRRVWRTLLELCGPVLILTSIGALLGMTLHVRVAASKLLLVTESIACTSPSADPSGGGPEGGGPGGKTLHSATSTTPSTGGKHKRK